MRNRALLFVSLMLTLSGWGQAASKPVPAIPSPEQRTARYLDRIRNQPSLLLEFLQAMPKGADLHTHLSGSIYAENYIRWAAEDGICLNRQTSAYVAPPCDAEKGTVPAAQILKDPGLYQQVINAQSMRFFHGPESGHDHFFTTFGKFGLVSAKHQGDMLAEIASRAAAQHESYMETLLAPDHGAADRFVKQQAIPWSDDFSAMRQAMLEKGIGKVVAEGRKNLDQFEAREREVLHCGTPRADPGCNVMVHYQYEIHRGLRKQIVFAEMLVGFEMAAADPRVVDVNLVMPEDAYVPMHDFDLHMRMLDYFHHVYPRVHLSLHAGEIWFGLVPPEQLRDHIRKSIEIGHAERIGHGVDVMFEDNPAELLQEMAKKKIAVEINLSSNDLILGVKGNEHPLPIYLSQKVPVVISTDDEGVSRSDLTHEYLRALATYPITYPQLKQIVRNSLEYSFLPGKSLWTEMAAGRKNPACLHHGARCEQFLSANEKASLEYQLESNFAKFEAGGCCKLQPLYSQ